MIADPAVAHVARDLLDAVGVPNRLLHIRDFVWRGGDISLTASDERATYALMADWDEPVLEALPTQVGLETAAASVIDGRWRTRRVGYVLRVSVDVRARSAIAIATDRPLACVPYAGRRVTHVADALDAALRRYVDAFLDRAASVPEARARAAADLRRLAGRGAFASGRG